ncbi:DEKNAAC103760 [Brettanomyces naardenensis]|uniref:DEKNAAC103760 n=1 Tax=Brettanomyces naardenensis TaxID=13370 RepID=A0A448YP23_BRENA|nr:DEKNAAC103760 [Brettanomyces naardenensis]
MPYTDIVPQDEASVYASLVQLRSRLSEIRKDSKYSNNREILNTYQSVLDSINQLKELREIEGHSSDAPPNKVDSLIDEIFQLLSLFFVSFGLSDTAPATYASLTTVQRLLEHLNESGVYTQQDLEPIKSRLDEISEIIDSAQDEEDNTTTNEEIKLLKNKLTKAYDEYNLMAKKISDLPPEIQSLMDKLLSVKYQLLDLMSNNNGKSNGSSKSHQERNVERLSKELANLQSKCEKAIENESSDTSASEAVLKGILDDCHDYLRNLQIGQDKIDPHLRHTYEKLVKLHSILSDLLITRRWTLRTVDLFNYQRELNDVDQLRVRGSFGNSEYKGQSILLYLLRSCYAIIYKLLESSESVSEALRPLHNQLSTVHRCLLDLKRSGGITSMRELYPYQMKLTSIDNEAVDGIFMVDGEIPPGQATLTALLSECFDILHELKVDYYDKHASNDSENSKTANVIGTKALQESNYDYNNVEEEYNEGEDNLASYAASYNSDCPTDAE